MKTYWKILLVIIVIISFSYYLKQKLPYNLHISRIDTCYYIYDEGGNPIIAEGYYVAGKESNSKVKKIIQYSKNNLGLVVMILNEKNQINYIAIKPKPEQNYSELQVIYIVYSELQYKKLNMQDDWFKISWW